MSLIYYVIDTETTGLKAGWHEIIQISVIRCKDKQQRTTNVKADYPYRASPEALAVTRKSIHDLKNGIARSEAVELIHSFLLEDEKTTEHRCIIAHNASFDRRFLHAMWQSLGKNFPADLWLCTKEFTRKFAKRQGIAKPSLSLKSSMDLVKIASQDGAHNAVVDSINTLNLWEKLVMEQVPYASLVKRVPHNL